MISLKELEAVCEVTRGLNFTREIMGVSIYGLDFPKIQLTEEFFIEKFGNVIPEAFNDEFMKRTIRWAGCELFCLTNKA